MADGIPRESFGQPHWPEIALPPMYEIAQRAHQRLLASGFRTWLFNLLQRSLRAALAEESKHFWFSTKKEGQDALNDLVSSIEDLFGRVTKIERRNPDLQKGGVKKEFLTSWLRAPYRHPSAYCRSLSQNLHRAIECTIAHLEDDKKQPSTTDWCEAEASPDCDLQIRWVIDSYRARIERLRNGLPFKKGWRSAAVRIARIALEHAQLRLAFDKHIGAISNPNKELLASFPLVSRNEPIKLDEVKQFHRDRRPALDNGNGWGQEAFFITDTPLEGDAYICERAADLAERLYHRMQALPESELSRSNIWLQHASVSFRSMWYFWVRHLGLWLRLLRFLVPSRLKKLFSAETCLTRGPFVTAIYGPWGSGKTSMLRTIALAFKDRGTIHRPQNGGRTKGKRDKAATTDTPGYICVRFEPWRFEKEKDLIVPLVAQIATCVQEAVGNGIAVQKFMLRGRVKGITKVLLGCLRIALLRTGEVSSALGKSGGNDLIKATSNSAHDLYFGHSAFAERYYSVEEKFRLTLRDLIWTTREVVGYQHVALKQKRLAPIAVFVDDLDRCDPNQVKRLLESIKLYLNEPGIIHFLALDEEQVVRALGRDYKDAAFDSDSAPKQSQINSVAKRYLEKFFQHSIDLGDGFSPIANAIDTLSDDCWFELARINSGHASREFYAKTGLGKQGRGAYPLVAGTDWLCPYRTFSSFPDTKVLALSTTPPEHVDELDYALRDTRANAIFRLAHLFSVAKRNPRIIKQLTRWLYLTLRRGTLVDDHLMVERPLLHERVRDFAEEVFSVNYGGVWVNEFHSLREESRLAAYNGIYKIFDACGALALCELFPSEYLLRSVYEKSHCKFLAKDTGFIPILTFDHNNPHGAIDPSLWHLHFGAYLSAALTSAFHASSRDPKTSPAESVEGQSTHTTSDVNRSASSKDDTRMQQAGQEEEASRAAARGSILDDDALFFRCSTLAGRLRKGVSHYPSEEASETALKELHDWVWQNKSDAQRAAQTLLLEKSKGEIAYKYPALMRELDKLCRLREGEALKNLYIICRYASEGSVTISAPIARVA